MTIVIVIPLLYNGTIKLANRSLKKDDYSAYKNRL